LEADIPELHVNMDYQYLRRVGAAFASELARTKRKKKR